MKKASKFRRSVRIFFSFCLFTGIIGALLLAGVNGLVHLTVKNDIVSTTSLTKKYDCILILGAKVFDDGTPCDMLRDRLDTGSSLYFNGSSEKIIVSGDHGRTEYDEVNAMKNYLIKLGIPQEDIFTDHAGFSTYDSLYRAFDIFGAKSVIVVTQKFHLPRALFIAESYGLDAVGAQADLHTYAGVSYNYLREVPAIFKDFIKACLSLPAKYGGESISLTEDASASDG